MRLVVFDLDGTVTRRDTLLPYALGFLRHSGRNRLRLLGAAPAALAYLLGRASRGDLKAALIRATMGGATRAQVEAWNEGFVPRVLERGCLAPALAAIDEHRARGDLLVLMSASVDLYVPRLARALGFADVVCTGVRWEGDRLQGDLTTANRRGEEKVRCLRELQASHPGLQSVAYGNAGSDLPHLRLVDAGWLVNAPARLRRRARGMGIGTDRW